MIDITFRLNGVDWSDKLSTYTVRYELEEVRSIRTMDYTEHVAMTKRPHIIFKLVPLTDAQAADLYDTLSAGNVLVNYTDVNLGLDTTATMRIRSDISYAFGLRSVDGNRYYKGTEITLRQNTVV